MDQAPTGWGKKSKRRCNEAEGTTKIVEIYSSGQLMRNQDIGHELNFVFNYGASYTYYGGL